MTCDEMWLAVYTSLFVLAPYVHSSFGDQASKGNCCDLGQFIKCLEVTLLKELPCLNKGTSLILVCRLGFGCCNNTCTGFDKYLSQAMCTVLVYISSFTALIGSSVMNIASKCLKLHTDNGTNIFFL